MANVDAPFGMRPVRYASGSPYNGACNKYYVQGDYATALFIGDPVVKTGESNTALVRGYNPGTLPSINKAAATTDTPITGVIVGFEPVSDESTVYNPASTERVALVADDPDLLFHIQDDGGGTLTAGTVGLNGNLIFTHSGSTVTGASGAELDGGTTNGPDTTVTDQLKILRLANFPNNELADFAIWEVKINRQSDANITLGL